MQVRKQIMKCKNEKKRYIKINRKIFSIFEEFILFAQEMRQYLK